ncbi:MAG TPA: type III PLP-dependent enzyme [Candidatus Saccharimonadales bacterium]|nr:type III PLP-dependent enzyme [Candidatus Saccharimonadales bacterium]
MTHSPEHGGGPFTNSEFISAGEHDRLVEKTSLVLEELVGLEAFQAAVAPKDASTEVEVFVVYPHQNDIVSQLRRAGADRFNEHEFAIKDADEPRETRQEFVPYREGDIRILIVRHWNDDRGSQPVAAMRLVGPVPGLPAHSLTAIETEWGRNVQQTIEQTTMPDGSPVPPGLLQSDTVYDIALASVSEAFRKGGETPDDRVLMALYSAALKVAKARGGTHMVGAMDVAGVFDQLRRRGPKYWGEFAGIERKTVMSRVPNSNLSTAAIGDIQKWEADTAQNRRFLYDLLWGDTLQKRGVAFTGIEDAEPLLNSMAMPDVLRPERLRDLPHGTPFLFLDLEAVGRRLEEFEEELPGVDVHYAMKCNPDRTLLRYLHRLGSGFEVASIAELRTLQALGADPRDVLFSNPVKVPSHIKQAADAGLYRFAFDSYQELEKIAAHAPGASVYVRLATSAINSVVHSEGKFGTDTETARRLLQEAGKLGLRAYGIAFHVGSQVEDPELWRHAIRTSGQLMRDLGGLSMQMLDMGGGFPAHHKKRMPSVAEIAAVINESLEAELPYLPRKLAIEPGRGLVSDAGVMVASVIGVVERGGKHWVHLDLGGFTMFEALETSNELDYPVADSRLSAQRMKANIAAATCDSMDTVLYGNRGLSADLKVGDRVFIYAAGAYTTSYASSFNGFPKPTLRYPVPELARFGIPSTRLGQGITNIQAGPDQLVIARNHNGFGAWREPQLVE